MKTTVLSIIFLNLFIFLGLNKASAEENIRNFSYVRVATCLADFECRSNDICRIDLLASSADLYEQLDEQVGFVSLYMGKNFDQTFDENILVPATLTLTKSGNLFSYQVKTTKEFPSEIIFNIGPAAENEAFKMRLKRNEYKCTMKGLMRY